MNMLYTIKTPAEDKLKHFYIGSLVTAISFVVVAFVVIITGVSLAWLLLSGIPAPVVGIYKELRDKSTGRGEFEYLDIVATAAPAIVLVIEILLILYILSL